MHINFIRRRHVSCENEKVRKRHVSLENEKAKFVNKEKTPNHIHNCKDKNKPESHSCHLFNSILVLGESAKGTLVCIPCALFLFILIYYSFLIMRTWVQSLLT